MKRINQSLLLLGLVTIVIVGIVYFQGQSILATLAKTKLSLTLWLVLLNIPFIALGGLAFDILCRPYQIYLRWQDWFGLSFIANLMNQLLPYRPGMGFRYLYLNQHYKMTLSQFTFIMVIYFLIMLLCGLVFTASGWFITGLPTEFYKTLYISLGVAIALGILFILLKWLKAYTEKLSLALSLFLKSPRILLLSCLTLLFMQLLNAVLLAIAFKALGSPIPFLHCLFLTGLISIAMIIPVTPGNIGVLETLMGTLTQLMYNNFTLGFSAMALFRASQWVVSVIFGIYFSLKMVGRIIPRFSAVINLGDRASVD